MNGFLYALSIALPSPIPYIAAIVLGAILFIVLVTKFPTLRSFRKKRILLIYVVAVLVFGLLIFQTYDTILGPAFASSSIQPSNNKYISETVNQFNVTVTDFGLRAANFYLVLKSVNASLQTQNQPGYIQVNSATLKIPFSFQTLHQIENKPIFFTIDANVTSFSINQSIDHQSGVSEINWMNGISCYWNNTDNSYSTIQFSMAPMI